MSWNGAIPIDWLIDEAKRNGTWKEPVEYTGIHEFEIDEEYLTSVVVAYGFSAAHENKDGEITKCSTHGTTDHPSFAALRNHLESRGFIEVERSFWNGDRVLVPFKLNGHLFEKGEKFPSGGAMKGHLKWRSR